VETLRKPLATSGPLLALGNPDLGDSRLDLPAAEEEVKAIAAIAKAPAAFVRADASAERFRAGTRGAGIVHVAAHATVDDVDAIRSTLHLSGGDIEAREVYDLDLRSASLVALSACSSGVGRVSRGDEFWGFKRSFLVAGARSLVVSLWPVADEATGQLMVSFYRERERSGAAEALRQAQLATRRDHPHPLFWAPFIVVGDWR
jgi:CHAT domain-containing protein